MKTFVAVVLALLGLAACGDDGQQELDAPAPHEVLSVRTVSQTAGGGAVQSTASRLTGTPPAAPFFADLTDAFVTKLQDAVRRAEPGGTHPVFAQVISVGCDIPNGTSAHFAGDRVVVEPGPVASPTRECFAPVTTVALVVVSSA